MNDRLKIKKCMIQLQREAEISIIDYFSTFNSIVFLISSEDSRKLGKNKSIIKKFSKRAGGKFLNYISLPGSIREAAKQCLYPLEIVDFVVEKNNGKTTLFYLIDQCRKDSVLNWHRSKFRMSEILLQKHFSVDNIRIKGINPDLYGYHGKKLWKENVF